MSDTNNNIPTRITQLEEATEYEDGMFYAVAKAGRGTYKIPVDEMTPNEQALSDKIENEIMPAVENSFAYGTVDESAIASFPDGSELPLKVLEVAVNPVQDLHGQDSPWPAGAGKNKIPQIPSSFTSGDVLVDYGSEKTFNGYALSLKFSGSFVNGGAAFLVGKDSNDTNVVIITPQNMKKTSDGTAIVANTTYTNESVYFTSNANVNIRKFLLYTYPSFTNPTFTDCQFENGNTVTTYQPYANICPISGRSAVDVMKRGVNIWDEEWVNGRWGGSGGVLNPAFVQYVASKNKIPVKPNMSFNFIIDSEATTAREVIWFDINGDYISDATTYYDDRVYTVPSNAYYMTFNLGAGYGATYNHDISINYPSTDTEYHAYNGHTYTISLNGTRYGGKLRIINGVAVFVADIVKKTLNGTEDWELDRQGAASNCFSIPLTDAKKVVSSTGETIRKIMSKHFITPTIVPTANDRENKAFVCTFNDLYPNSFLNIGKSSQIGNTVADFKSWLESNNETIIYELATPIIIELGEVEIDSLKGYNNISADTGNILKVEYIRDLDIVINSLLERIAALEG